MKSPCYKCDDRVVGCHAECEKYQSFAAARNEINEKRYRESTLDCQSVGQESRQRSKAKSKQNHRMHW